MLLTTYKLEVHSSSVTIAMVVWLCLDLQQSHWSGKHCRHVYSRCVT